MDSPRRVGRPDYRLQTAPQTRTDKSPALLPADSEALSREQTSGRRPAPGERRREEERREGEEPTLADMLGRSASGGVL